MALIYKDEEITARVCKTYSDLYSLNEDGSLGESEDIRIEHNDPEVVWYEVGDMSHLECSRGYFTQIPTIDEAKKRIDAYALENPVEDES